MSVELAENFIAVDAAIDLDVRDASLRSNGGKYRLVVGGGAGEVKRGGRGALRMDEKALAALFSGHLSATALASMGRIEGGRRAIERAAAIFGGPPPSLPDLF